MDLRSVRLLSWSGAEGCGAWSVRVGVRIREAYGGTRVRIEVSGGGTRLVRSWIGIARGRTWLIRCGARWECGWLGLGLCWSWGDFFCFRVDGNASADIFKASQVSRTTLWKPSGTYGCRLVLITLGKKIAVAISLGHVAKAGLGTTVMAGLGIFDFWIYFWVNTHAAKVGSEELPQVVHEGMVHKENWIKCCCVQLTHGASYKDVDCGVVKFQVIPRLGVF